MNTIKNFFKKNRHNLSILGIMLISLAPPMVIFSTIIMLLYFVSHFSFLVICAFSNYMIDRKYKVLEKYEEIFGAAKELEKLLETNRTVAISCHLLFFASIIYANLVYHYFDYGTAQQFLIFLFTTVALCQILTLRLIKSIIKKINLHYDSFLLK